MEDTKDIKTVEAPKATKTVKASKPKKAVKKAKTELKIDLVKYVNNLALAVAHAKQEAGLELDKADREALAIEATIAKKANTTFAKVKKFFTNLFKHNK